MRKIFKRGLSHLHTIGLFVAILLSCPFSFGSTDFKARVIKIADGDTITVLREGNIQIKIRFADIDCPERGQPWGRNATEALKQIIANNEVGVEALGKDRYGRTIARVYVDSVNINRNLVESGNCWVYPKYAKDQILFSLEDKAKAAKRGLWQLPEADIMAPWEWRKRK